MDKKLRLLKLKEEASRLELEIVRGEWESYCEDFDKHFQKFYQNPKKKESDTVWVNEETGEVKFKDPLEHIKKAEEERKEREKEIQKQRELLKNAPAKVKNLYKKLASKTHPDKRGGSTEKFQSVKDMYEKLDVVSLLKIADEFEIKYELDSNDEELFTRSIQKNLNEVRRLKGTIGWTWGVGDKSQRQFCVKRVKEETGWDVPNEDLPKDLQKEETKLIDKGDGDGV